MVSARKLIEAANPHPQRKEIARYLLSRGLDAQTMAPSVEHLELAATSTPRRVQFPARLAPLLVPVAANHDPNAPLPLPMSW